VVVVAVEHRDLVDQVAVVLEHLLLLEMLHQVQLILVVVVVDHGVLQAVLVVLELLLSLILAHKELLEVL